MLITLQFPFADSRAFVSHDTYKLALPSWLTPVPDCDFIRSFGVVRRRPKGGLTGWVGETYICEANHAIRFQSIEAFRDDLGNSIKFKIAFRRFYFDGVAVGKFEVGLAAWGFKKRFWNFNKKILSANTTRELITHILRLPILVPNFFGNGNPVKCQLWQAGQPLAKLYATSSTLKRVLSTDQHCLEDWWIQSCEPIILIVHKIDRESLQVPFWGKSLDFPKIDGTLSHYFIPHQGQRLRMWLIGEDSTSVTLRQLRIFLLRLHAERTCLRQILRNISTGKLLVPRRSKQSRTLQEYLNDSTKRISKLNKHSDSRTEAEVGQLAREAEEYILPGECDALIRALKVIDVEKNILQKVEDFVQQLTIIKEQNIVSEQYNVSGQAGAVGSNAHAHDMTFNQQIGSQIEKTVDLEQLANELATLRQAMIKESKEVGHSIAVGEIAKAEQAATSKDATKVVEYLKAAGQWALDIASKVGVPIAIEALKRAMGIPL
jgi:hypothetical protein